MKICLNRSPIFLTLWQIKYLSVQGEFLFFILRKKTVDNKISATQSHPRSTSYSRIDVNRLRDSLRLTERKLLRKMLPG